MWYTPIRTDASERPLSTVTGPAAFDPLRPFGSHDLLCIQSMSPRVASEHAPLSYQHILLRPTGSANPAEG